MTELNGKSRLMGNGAGQLLSSSEGAKRNLLKQEKPYVYEKILNYEEKVKNGESIAILQFQYDYTCNFTCVHCSIDRFQHKTRTARLNDGRRYFAIPDIRELSRQADEMGLAHFVITGGEPLVFPDFDEIVEAVDPQKFYVVSDTNGWLLTPERARHLKSIGVDKIQVSLDSLDEQGHDDFRRKPGSHTRVIKAIDAAVEAGLNIILSTVVTKQRAKTQEFIEFLEFAKEKEIGTYVTYGKPVGAWEGNLDILMDKEDTDYIKELEKKYNVFTHLTPSYGLDLGCIAVKRMVSITKYGDIMPCPYIHVSLGNFFEEPLKDIITRGLNIKYFGEYTDLCLTGEDKEFVEKFVTPTYGKSLPVPYTDVFSAEDFINPPE